MVDIIHLLETQFELVLLDAPPSLVVTDANVLANRADGVLLVIHPSTTKRAAIRHTIEQLTQVKANIVGVVLNGVDVNKSRYSYYRGYYQKYGRGYAYYSDGRSNDGGKVSIRRRNKAILKADHAEKTLKIEEGGSRINVEIPGPIKNDIKQPNTSESKDPLVKL